MVHMQSFTFMMLIALLLMSERTCFMCNTLQQTSKTAAIPTLSTIDLKI